MRTDSTTSDCTTTASFADHGVTDGSDLIRRTYYRLAADGGGEFEPTDRFFERLADAFRRAYLTSAGEYEVPDRVAAAVEDARARTATAFADEPEADLRTDVLPTFYRRAAGFHCRYRP